ncbi:Uncharacterised protein [Mycobacterium tuberculosis]|nr:Uncharacterised protein [Mycobacterium tuberculosis]
MRFERSTPKRSHSASSELRLPGYTCLAMASVSVTSATKVRSGGKPARSNSLLRKPTSKAAL